MLSLSLHHFVSQNMDVAQLYSSTTPNGDFFARMCANSDFQSLVCSSLSSCVVQMPCVVQMTCVGWRENPTKSKAVTYPTCLVWTGGGSNFSALGADVPYTPKPNITFPLSATERWVFSLLEWELLRSILIPPGPAAGKLPYREQGLM